MEMRNLFYLTATELACTMGEIMKLCVGDVRWLLQNGRDWGCGNGGACWSMWADCCGWVRFSANACVWICWRWGTSMGVEWATMGRFYWKPMGGRRGRNRRPNLKGGKGGRETERLILWLVVLELLLGVWWWLSNYLSKVSVLST